MWLMPPFPGPDRDFLVFTHSSKTIEVWIEDEVRFGQNGTLTTVLAEIGSRPTTPKQGGIQNLHALAVVARSPAGFPVEVSRRATFLHSEPITAG